jgi:putative peptidoglycan lipid II flippase
MARNDIPQLKKTLIFTLENILFVLVPSSVLLILFSHPLIRILFERGEFNAYSTEITATAMLFYALGLPAYGGIKILVSGFHAMHDTKTPVMAAGVCLVINAVLNFALMYPFKIGGITLASSIAGTVDFFILFYLMDKKLGGMKGDLMTFFFKTLVASCVMGGLVWWSWQAMASLNDVVRLIVVGIEGYLVFWLVCWRLKVPQAVVIWQWLNGERRRHERDAGQ